MLTQTPITYNEAAKLINKSRSTIEKAVERDVLIKLPTTNLQQYLIKEQVMLFNRKQLRISALSENDLELWMQHKKQAENLFSTKGNTKLDIREVVPEKIEVLGIGLELRELLKRGIKNDLSPEERKKLEEKKRLQTV